MTQQCPTSLRFPCIRPESGQTGLTAAELATVLAPFVAPLISGRFSIKTLFLSKNADQATTIPATVTWEISSGNISFAANRATLEGGGTYLMLSVARLTFSSTNASFGNLVWYDVTNDEAIEGVDTIGHGKTASIRPVGESTSTTLSFQDMSGAIVTPSANTVVEVQLNAEANLTEIDALATYALIFGLLPTTA